MAEKAKHIRKDGTHCIVTAKEAAQIPKSERNFRCIGKDSHGRECGKGVSLVKSERDGKVLLYFRGKEHIEGCNQSCHSPEATVYIDAIDGFSFEKFFRPREEDRAGGNSLATGINGCSTDYSDVEEDDAILGIIERPRSPKGVKTLYEVLSLLPLDAEVDGKEVGEILVTRESLANGYTCLKGEKVLTVERCWPPEGFEKNDSQIVVRVCYVRGTYLVLNVPDKEVRRKVWNLIFPKKNSEIEFSEGGTRKTRVNLPRVLVAGKVSHLRDNIWTCDVLNSRMVCKCPRF